MSCNTSIPVCYAYNCHYQWSLIYPEELKSVPFIQPIFYKDMLINSMFLDHIFCYFNVRLISGHMPYCFLSPAVQHSETLAQNKRSSQHLLISLEKSTYFCNTTIILDSSTNYA